MAIEIASLPIGADHPPFVIAEMSGNHNQSMDRALAIVEAAAQAGAHAIKLQTYTADTMALDVRGGSFEISDPDSLWAGHNLHALPAGPQSLGVARPDHGARPRARPDLL